MPQYEDVKAILAEIGPQLLSAEYKKGWTKGNPCWGYCYIVSEAIYHYCAEKTVSYCVNLGRGYGNHWFLQSINGVKDYTSEQFSFRVPYHLAQRRSFLQGSIKTPRGFISKRGYNMAVLMGLTSKRPKQATSNSN